MIPEDKRIKSVNTVQIPDGKYTGYWSGYVVDVHKLEYSFNVNVGVRGIFVPVNIEVIDGIAYISTKGN